MSTRIGDELTDISEEISGYDGIAAVDLRALLRAMDFDPEPRRLAELGPPRKSIKLDGRGRTLKITTALLIRGSCGIHQPFGDPRVLRGYLDDGQTTRLRRRLEADAKSLFALYQYVRAHGSVRLRWGFLDERIPAPWVHRDEPTLWNLEQRALERDVPLEIVAGAPQGWKGP